MADYIEPEGMSCSSTESGSEDEVSSSGEGSSLSQAKKTTPKKKEKDVSSKEVKKRKTRNTTLAAQTTSKEIAKPRRKKAKGNSIIKMDIAKSKNHMKIPEFEVHIGKEWYVKVSFYEGNDRYYICLRNCSGNKTGFGANLPIEMVDELVRGFTLAQSHIKDFSDIPTM